MKRKKGDRLLDFEKNDVVIRVVGDRYLSIIPVDHSEIILEPLEVYVLIKELRKKVESLPKVKEGKI